MKGDICSIEGCDKLVRSGNICQGHNWRMKVYKSYSKPSRRKYGNTCKVVDCNNPRDLQQRSSLCTMHRVRISRHKSLELPEKNKLPNGIAKICIHHGELRIEDTYPVPGKTWLHCKICRTIRSEKFRDSRPPGFKQTRNYIFLGTKGKYVKLEIKEYQRMLDEQRGLCAICQKSETMVSPHDKTKTKSLAIDHSHTTGKIRGLLCHHCNTGMGHLQDSIEILESAIQYLKESQ